MTTKPFLLKSLTLAAALSAFAVLPAAAQDNIRGSTTGPTSAPGHSHPDQFAHVTAVKPADNMYAVIQHPDQDKAAADKLAALAKKTGKKPNFLVFLLDDVGWMDPGFNGGGIAVGQPTPTMDQLANAGLVLTSAYSTPSCTPSRATIHTGQNPLHHGLLRPPMYDEPGGLGGAVTMPSILQQQGYVTQGVGKWHMGENKGSLPQNLGYDDYRGFLGVSDMYTEWRDVYFNPEVALSPERFKMLEKDNFNHYEVHCTPEDKKQCKNGKLIDLAYIKDLDKHWLETSLAFLDKMKGSDKPFYLYHGTRGCHFDNYPSDEWAGRSMARTSFSDCMVHMDYVFGQLMKKLEEIGEAENTLVILTSDNGPECEIPPRGRTPFRGCKGSSWEGGVRVPTFVYWKGMVTPRKSDQLFDLADILPTALHLAGYPGKELATLISDDTYIDGVDQAPWFVADEGLSARRSRIYTLNQYFAAVRIDEFKGVTTGEIENGVVQRGYTGGFSGFIFTDTGGGIVFNLYTNPQEDVSIGIRHIPMSVPLGATGAQYLMELFEYPPQFKVGFPSNNPPVYDVLPVGEMAVKAWLKKHGFGRVQH